jgi:hypothetical protein
MATLVNRSEPLPLLSIVLAILLTMFISYQGQPVPGLPGHFPFNFQPVLPMPLTKDWNLIPRPVIPFLTNPYIRGVDTVTGQLDWSRTAGPALQHPLHL